MFLPFYQYTKTWNAYRIKTPDEVEAPQPFAHFIPGMIVKIIFIFFILLLSGCSSLNLAHLLNEQVIIAETSPQAPPLNVRIIKLTDHGECHENECPLSEFYIAVSEYGEYPKQVYYVTPKRHNWSFVKWLKQADFSEQMPYAKFVVNYEKNGDQVSQVISVSLDSIQYEK